jgi:hypothetical protein
MVSTAEFGTDYWVLTNFIRREAKPTFPTGNCVLLEAKLWQPKGVQNVLGCDI